MKTIKLDDAIDLYNGGYDEPYDIDTGGQREAVQFVDSRLLVCSRWYQSYASVLRIGGKLYEFEIRIASPDCPWMGTNEEFIKLTEVVPSQVMITEYLPVEADNE